MPGPDSVIPVGGRARPWRDLRLRVMSALVLLPVGLGCLWLGGGAWFLLVMLGALGLVVEWSALCRVPPIATPAVLLAVLVACGLAAAAQAPLALLWLAAWTGVAWVWLRRPAPALGIIYVGLPAVSLIWLRSDGIAGRDGVLFVLLVVWATDVAAYLVGRLVGGPRLWPAISPGKTWSGAAGGLAGALLVGWAAGRFAMPLAALLSIVAQAGDLMESALKRRFGVKDSGRLIPGHGGLLDRLDGVLTAAPVAALLALAFGPGAGFWQ